ncbi:hypothetical protein [Streptomyces nigrescens]|uniref:Uncharacterized protein n=1 Tax=Streptomyces nigrescens TaxID=1920 RepID=A0A640TC99_STRNI|nr:hypothetical protein [Streptomyces libani]WAT94952.1 hypothetical protein STRLI_000624 [Streptomyces libani subsp. libani]GFE20101.1 hypothetical protein Sliba_05540 [Streptomyces libani subsp. libani]GGV85875.1 hypothetical protein GCM10010500_03070 [Streptomyces libani subsp. libani]
MATAQISVEARVAAGVDHLDRTLGVDWPHRVDVDDLPFRDVISQLYGDFFSWRSRERWSDGSVFAAGFDAPSLDGVPELTREWTRRINALQAARPAA